MRNGARFVAAWSFAVLIGALTVSHADDVFWDEDQGGAWNTGANWMGGDVPGEDDTAIFNLGQSPAYQVNVTDSFNLGSLRVDNDSVILNISPGESITLTEVLDPPGGPNTSNNTFEGLGGLMVGRGFAGDPHTGVLTVQGGGSLVMPSFLVGGTTTSVGTLNVSGAGTTISSNATATNETLIGNLGEGNLNILNGGTGNFVNITMGRHSVTGISNTVTVSGTGSVLNYTRLDIAHRNDSTVIVSDGAHISGNNTNIGIRARPSLLEVDNATASLGNTRLGWHGPGAQKATGSELLMVPR